MTRKDYELIAAALKRATKASETDAARSAIEDLARDLAGELVATNPRFDTARFLNASGVEA